MNVWDAYQKKCSRCCMYVRIRVTFHLVLEECDRERERKMHSHSGNTSTHTRLDQKVEAWGQQKTTTTTTTTTTHTDCHKTGCWERVGGGRRRRYRSSSAIVVVVVVAVAPVLYVRAPTCRSPTPPNAYHSCAALSRWRHHRSQLSVSATAAQDDRLAKPQPRERNVRTAQRGRERETQREGEKGGGERASESGPAEEMERTRGERVYQTNTHTTHI